VLLGRAETSMEPLILTFGGRFASLNLGVTDPLQAICEVILRRRKEGVRDRRGTRRDFGDHAYEINGSSAAGSVESE